MYKDNATVPTNTITSTTTSDAPGTTTIRLDSNAPAADAAAPAAGAAPAADAAPAGSQPIVANVASTSGASSVSSSAVGLGVAAAAAALVLL
ncbi:hypothetical protein RMCBS344292_18506 [Rhizopus microsporus]|nr:hypothetical protein RMCBS344292_18506 [Rhizopus microsporus]